MCGNLSKMTQVVGGVINALVLPYRKIGTFHCRLVQGT